MRWFGHKNNETTEREISEFEADNNTSEINKTDESAEKKLNSSERSKAEAFRNNLKVEPQKQSDTEKLDSPNDDSGERGDFERSHDGGKYEGER